MFANLLNRIIDPFSIIAFSSDSRMLYKGDIYKALTLPAGSILHFRYKLKYMDSQLVASPNKCEGRSIYIFHTKGNYGTEENSNKMKHIPIRKGKIYSCFKSEDTEACHLYIKLGDFFDCEENALANVKKPENKIFLSKIPNFSSHKVSWQNRINELKDNSFEVGLFIYCKGIWKKGKKISPKIDKFSKASFYPIVHGRGYILKLAIANPSDCYDYAKVKWDENLVGLDLPEKIETSLQYDDEAINFFIKKLEVKEQHTSIKISPTIETRGSEFASNIQLRIKKSISSSILFGFMASAALFLYAILKENQSSILWIIGFFSAWFLASTLHHFFNKK